MRSLKVIALSLALTLSAHAASLPNLGGLLGGLFGGGGTGTSSIQTLLLNAGLTYAKSDPRFAVVLTALGINNAQDLQNFLQGDSNGNNFKDIIVHAAFQYAQSNPKFSDWLSKVGVTDEPSLRAFLNGKGSKYKDTIFQMALAYAKSNPKYAAWLDQLEISNISDITDILNGGLQGSNIQSLILSYLKSNPKYAQYASILSLLLGQDALSSTNISDMFLGAYDGLPVSEIKLIQKTKKTKAKK